MPSTKGRRSARGLARIGQAVSLSSCCTQGLALSSMGNQDTDALRPFTASSRPALGKAAIRSAAVGLHETAGVGPRPVEARLRHSCGRRHTELLGRFGEETEPACVAGFCVGIMPLQLANSFGILGEANGPRMSRVGTRDFKSRFCPRAPPCTSVSEHEQTRINTVPSRPAIPAPACTGLHPETIQTDTAIDTGNLHRFWCNRTFVSPCDPRPGFFGDRRPKRGYAEAAAEGLSRRVLDIEVATKLYRVNYAAIPCC